MRFLFVKARLEWPRTYGHDVHCYEMMRAFAALGHDVALATDRPPSPEATAGLRLTASWVLEAGTTRPDVPLSYWQERYRSYWGIEKGRIAHLRELADRWQADVLVVVGLEILPYLGGAGKATRVWYAADEWVWHYVSQLWSDPGGVVDHLKTAAIKGFYERVYGPIMDRVWVVSESERRAMRIVAGVRHVDVLPNGVDTDRFAPQADSPRQNSAIFWGRLGFGPNVHALRWFCTRVWPIIRREVPNANFVIAGADPPAEVSALAAQPGIELLANPLDLRPVISNAQVVVLPLVSGGGIKNKLLEAASMARPIVATRQATTGLRSLPPAIIADEPATFAEAVLSLWRAPDRAEGLGREARAWVCAHHTWRQTAVEALKGFGVTESRAR